MKTRKEKFVDKTYKLTRDAAPLSFILPTRHTKRFPLLYFDENTGINRELRYARNQKTIFADEQDGNILLEPIVFEDGFLMVRRNNPILQKFLAYHPLNGKRFIEINNERAAEEDLEVLSLEADALLAAKTLDIKEAENIVKVVFGKDTSRLTSAEIKRDVLVYAKQDPFEFLEFLEDPMLDIQGQVQSFFEQRLLVTKTKGGVFFNTKSNKKRMLVVPPGKDKLLIVGSYLQSDDGIESLKMLEKLVENEEE